MATTTQQTTTTTTTTNIQQTAVIPSPFFTDLQQPIKELGKQKIINIVDDNKTFTVGLDSKTIGVYTGSVNNKVYFTVHTGSSDGSDESKRRFSAIKNLLKRDFSKDNVDNWKIDKDTDIKSFAVVSFDNSVFGGKLYPGSSGKQFKITINDTGYTASAARIADGQNYDLKYQYSSRNSGFAQLFTGDDPNVKGYLFGELGLILFTSSATTCMPAEYWKVTGSKFIYKETTTKQTHFCRITNQKYNASNNPTWYRLDEETGVYVIRHTSSDQPGMTFTAITTIGLFSENNELLAIAKLSKPALKYRDSELHVKIDIEY